MQNDEHTDEETRAVDRQLVDLVRRTMTGDRAAFSSLHDITAPQVFRTARAVLGSKEDAEEIVCEVFIFVWLKADAYDCERGSVRAWLAIVARNRSIDRLRQRRACRSQDDGRPDDLTVSLACPAPGPEQLLARAQARTALDQALRSLSGLRRQLIEMSFFEELTHEEIARSIRVPLGTVKSHVRRSLATMRRELAPHPTAQKVLKKRSLR